MKRYLLTMAIACVTGASVVSAEAGMRSGGVVRGARVSGFRAPMLARTPAPARVPGVPLVASQPNPGNPNNRLGFGPRPGGLEGRGPLRDGRLGRAGFETPRGGERFRRWRGLPIYGATIGGGYPYNGGYSGGYDAGGDGPYAPPPPVDYSERYTSNVAVVPMQPQIQFNPGPRIIYVHDPRDGWRQGPGVAPGGTAPGPRIIYRVRPHGPANEY